jgi:hypothetical protein
MGQDTRCKIGVTYHCKCIPKNYELIEKLIKMEDMFVFIYADDKGSDEMLDITDAMLTSAIFKDLVHDLKMIGNEVVFKIDVYVAHVRNMSRRKNNTHLFDEYSTPIVLISKIQQIVDEFKSFGVNAADIAIGHTFTDD